MIRRFVIAALLLIAGCTDQPTPTGAIRPYDDGTGISWLTGDVDAVFAQAAQAHKPVFLYWGAKWCPPCQEIRTTVFNTRAFQERAQRFMAVYLDGDTTDAQRYGERFAVMGYPTMIVFAPDGSEVTRIPNGIDIGAYAEVLDVALSTLHPVADIAAAALRGDAPTPGECRLFAYYAWGQDNEQILKNQDEVALFEAATAQCGAEHQDAARLFLLYLTAVSEAEDDARLDRAAAVSRLHRILSEPGAIDANAGTLISHGSDFAELLTAPGSEERPALTAALADAFEQIGSAERTSTSDRLYASLAKVRLEHLDGDAVPIPEPLEAEILTRVALADATTTDPAERQTVINAAANVLIEAGLFTQAEELLMREIGRSEHPYYFMTGLAELAEEQGDRAAALAWLKRAHAESRGPATRFQWGRQYVGALIRLTPDDGAKIEATTIALLKELSAGGNVLYHRNARLMQRLQDELIEWNADGTNESHIDAIREAVHANCPAIPPGDPSRARCEAFLKV